MRDCRDAAVAGKIVLMRVDFNVPVVQGRISDDTRIVETVPGLEDLSARGARVVLLSHRGRPKGRHDSALSLAPIAEHLQALLGRSVALIPDIDALFEAARDLHDGEVALLENLRFDSREESNDAEFAEKLAAAGEIYINDAFSCAHRAHASMEALAHRLPSFAGPLLLREVEALQKHFENPPPPLMAIVGGAKVSTKIALLKNLTMKAETLVIAGGMANVFLHQAGFPIGKSLCEEDMAHLVQEILDSARAHDCTVLLPVDAVCALSATPEAVARPVADLADVRCDEMILDVGDGTLTRIEDRLARANVVIMNGPLGVFEIAQFAHGTNRLCAALARRAREGAAVIAGGGDTVAAVKLSGHAADFTYLSTAGGAFLEWLEGKTLPGIAALETNER